MRRDNYFLQCGLMIADRNVYEVSSRTVCGHIFNVYIEKNKHPDGRLCYFVTVIHYNSVTPIIINEYFSDRKALYEFVTKVTYDFIEFRYRL